MIFKEGRFGSALMSSPSLGRSFDSFYEELQTPDSASASPYRSWSLRQLSAEGFSALSPEGRLGLDAMAYFACYGVLAPTSHNSVPQRFRFRPDDACVEIWMDRRYVLTASDASGRQAAISLGCCISNMTQAARCYGWDADVRPAALDASELTPCEGNGADRYKKAAEIVFRRSSGSPPSRAPLAAMLRRKMVRAEYDGSSRLSPEMSADMQRCAARYPKIALHLISDVPTLFFLGKFQELADTTVLNREDFALELGQWFLENQDASFLGMRGREFGLSDSGTRRLREGLLGERPLLPDEVAAFAKVGNLGIRSSAAVCVLTVAVDDIPGRLEAGQAFNDLALLAESGGFRVSMHAAITEVLAPNLALRSRLRTAQRPTVVFRVGRPLDPSHGERPHPSRPPLEELLLS